MKPRIDPKPQSAAKGKTYRKQILVRFSDCDPAGIVFYPKYFEMFNSLIEDWCQDILRFSFREIVANRGWGLPAVHLEADFLAPSRYGDRLNAALRLQRLGRSSITLALTFHGRDGVLRVNGKAILALIGRAKRRAIPYPPAVRKRLSAFAGIRAAETNGEPS